MQINTVLIIAGLSLLLLGLVWNILGKFMPLGNLPGDFKAENKHFKLYFPLTSSIILSMVLSLLLFIITKVKT